MRILHDGRDQDGNLVYFEVGNASLTRLEASRVVEIVRKPKRFALLSDEDEFCIFRWRGKTFALWEPFGDNDRFHISESPIGHSAELEQLRSAFQQYRARWGILRWAALLLFGLWTTYQAIQASRTCEPCGNSHAASGK